MNTTITKAPMKLKKYGIVLERTLENVRNQESETLYKTRYGSLGIDMEDDGKSFPTPTPIESVMHKRDEIVTLIDTDFAEYRKANECRTVRRNVSLASWLDHAAEKTGINVPMVLQAALIEKLGAGR